MMLKFCSIKMSDTETGIKITTMKERVFECAEYCLTQIWEKAEQPPSDIAMKGFHESGRGPRKRVIFVIDAKKTIYCEFVNVFVTNNDGKTIDAFSFN